jgi:conjugal transfer/entry exclusion protein
MRIAYIPVDVQDLLVTNNQRQLLDCQYLYAVNGTGYSDVKRGTNENVDDQEDEQCRFFTTGSKSIGRNVKETL